MGSFELLCILIGILIIAAVSQRLSNTVITLPMLYTLFGLFIGLVFSEYVEISYEDPAVHLIIELTFMLILAVDASRINLTNLSRYHTMPLRLLFIALPLMIVMGTLVGAALFAGMDLLVLAILAVILTPADGDLAASVIENPKVPVRIRQALNVEGGLDDAISMSFLLLFISIAVSGNQEQVGTSFLMLTFSQVVFGVLAGLGMGFLGARYISWGVTSGWMSSKFQKIAWLAFVLLTFGLAEVLHGNGFIATFVFGLTSGSIAGPRETKKVDDFAEVENTLLMVVTFMLFGMVMLAPTIEHITLPMILYAVLSLTIVRMLPVAISMIGMKLKPTTVLFMGWFGPRGIASILYILLVVDTEEIVGKEMIFDIAVLTIFLSVIAHGISAAPLAEKYGARITQLINKGSADAEAASVPEVPIRRGIIAARLEQSESGISPKE